MPSLSTTSNFFKVDQFFKKDKGPSSDITLQTSSAPPPQIFPGGRSSGSSICINRFEPELRDGCSPISSRPQLLLPGWKMLGEREGEKKTPKLKKTPKKSHRCCGCWDASWKGIIIKRLILSRGERGLTRMIPVKGLNREEALTALWNWWVSLLGWVWIVLYCSNISQAGTPLLLKTVCSRNSNAI